MQAKSSDILFIPGTIISNPTDLVTDLTKPIAERTFGGTVLGKVAAIIWRPNEQRSEIIAEEKGGAVVDHTRTAQSPQLGGFLRGFDRDAMAKIYRDVTVSTLTGKAKVEYPPDLVGTLATDLSFVLLFAPDATEVHQGILMYNAYALLDEAAQMNYSPKEEFGTPTIFYGTEDDTNRVYQKLLMEDMVL